MPRFTEPFGAVPRRLADDLYAGGLTFHQLGVLVWITLRTNHNVDPPVWRGTTREMYEAMKWPYTMRHLRGVLEGLDYLGYTTSDRRNGSPKPYTIRLLKGATSRAGTELEESWNGRASVSSSSRGTDSSSDEEQRRS